MTEKTHLIDENIRIIKRVFKKGYKTGIKVEKEKVREAIITEIKELERRQIEGCNNKTYLDYFETKKIKKYGNEGLFDCCKLCDFKGHSERPEFICNGHQSIRIHLKKKHNLNFDKGIRRDLVRDLTNRIKLLNRILQQLGLDDEVKHGN